LSSGNNWNFTDSEDPSNEYELFDVDAGELSKWASSWLQSRRRSSENRSSADPFEMANLYQSASKELKESLHAKLETLYRCQGLACN
jgi:hypothetical protein